MIRESSDVYKTAVASLVNLSNVKLKDDRVEILGFNNVLNKKSIESGKFNAGGSTYTVDSNPNSYYIYYRFLPEVGKDLELENLFVHSVSLARYNSHVSALNVINDGSGNLLNRFVLDFKNAIK